jgi:hypothetical protein
VNSIDRPDPGFAFRSVNTIAEIVVDADTGNDAVWVPIRPGVSLRPMMFDVSNGGWSSLLRIAPGEMLACHYHTQPVHGFTLEGSWRYLEHNWVASEGTYIFEPPGEMHTLVADAKTGMTTFFVTRGALIYTDAEGRQIGYEDVFTRLAQCRDHYARTGRDPAELDALVR